MLIGEGKHTRKSLLEPEQFKIPEEFLIPATKDPLINKRLVIDFVYNDLKLNYKTDNYFADRVILAPLCAVVRLINNQIMDELPEAPMVYRSIDSVEETEGLDMARQQIEI